MTEPKLARTTLRLDKRLMREVKTLAVETGRTLTAVIEDSLRESLARRRQSSKAEPSSWPVLHLGPPLPGVDLNNSAALLDLMEEDDDPL